MDVYKVQIFYFNICCVYFLFQDRASQIAAIEATFEAAKQPVS